MCSRFRDACSRCSSCKFSNILIRRDYLSSDESFRILDVAARIGSGVGSYGVSRYYVLINALDVLLHDPDVKGVGISTKLCALSLADVSHPTTSDSLPTTLQPAFIKRTPPTANELVHAVLIVHALLLTTRRAEE